MTTLVGDVRCWNRDRAYSAHLVGLVSSP